MNKLIFVLFLCVQISFAQKTKKVITPQGQISFFSYTSVENIKAENNQVFSIIDLSDGSIAISMLMNTFIFEKALMKEHFNESYIESDLYPTATFKGSILKFDPTIQGKQIKMIEGEFKMHGVTKNLKIKATIENNKGTYAINGTFETLVEDYNINIPPLLAGNIAKNIEVNFNFEYQPYEN